jgi:HPt (histidine-containing phosphotransfer) domain-containing protein
MSQDIKQYIDVDDALLRMLGNKKLYVKTLNMFLAGKEFENWEAAIAENNLGKAGELVHTLKGVAGNLSLTALFDQSAQLMQKLRQGELDAAMIETYRETYRLTRDFTREAIKQLSAE